MSRLYRFLLRCYPAAFRARFGDELVGAFEAGLRASRRRGALALMLFAVTRLADAVSSGIAERWAGWSSAEPPGPGGAGARAAGWPTQDFRFALRVVRREPGFALVVVSTLALGIGANTAVFSVLDTVLLRPLPYADAARLVRVETANGTLHVSGGPASYPDFLDWRAADLFEDLGIYQVGHSVIRIGDTAERVRSAAASASLFSTLGVQPLLGRLPSADEDRPGPQPVVLLTEAIWRRRFASDPAILARPVTVDGKSLSVVGVLPAGFVFQSDPEFWTTFEDDGDVTRRVNRYLDVIGRLRPGVAPDTVDERLNALCARLDQMYTDSNSGWRARVVPWHESQVSGARPQLVLLTVSVTLVLLIGCSNVAMLLLVRGARRGRELAVRAALGASRRRIVSQLLTESLVLSLIGGGLGAGLATWWVSLLARFGPSDIPRLQEAAVDGRALAFALVASCAAAVLFGLVPALGSSRPDVNALLQDAGRSATPGRRRRAAANVLLIAETAISLVLLVGSALMVKSFVRLVQVDAGFRTDHLLTFQLPLPTTKFMAGGDYQRDRVRQYFERVISTLEARPDVESAAATLEIPLSGGGYRLWQGFEIPGRADTGRSRTLAVTNYVTPHFFSAMAIGVTRGRGLTDRDTAAAAPVTVVSERFVRTFLPGVNPLGQQLRLEGDERLWEVVGVVGDIKPDGLDSEPHPVVYKPFAQDPRPFMSIVVHTRRSPAALAAAVVGDLRTIDPDVPPYRVRPAEDLVARALGARRFGTMLMAAFGVAALGLALVGLYAVISSLVADGTREIGLRVALGARRAQVLRPVLRQALWPSAAGLGLGTLIALLAAPAMRALLFGVEPLDPLVLLLAPCALALACLLACVVPARRALRVDPVIALRAE